ncbi:MAG: hypothetical protein CSA49_06505 [Gammaproteobacteria bacterium]|nr:MAG: hypothetical protein CSA49_06505 [Gammaproteobacteria bacterium]
MTQESQESLDWKEKYLSSLESFERLRNADKERMNILLKGLVRISVAADGQDDELDKQLAALRTTLRSSQDILDLKPQVDALEKLVVALDDRRQNNNHTLEQLIEDSLAPFLESDLPRKGKSLIKKYQKVLSRLIEQDGGNLSLWKDYAAIQKIIADYVQVLEGTDGGKNDSLLKRLFVKDDVEDKPEPQDETAATLDIEAEAGASDTPSMVSGSNAEAHEQLRQRIASVVSSLLQQIELPDDSESERKALVKKIRKPFCWEELPDLLEEAANLVSSTRAEAQKEFEGFLASLHERLQDIQEFLVTARQGEEQAQLNQQKLDDEVRSELHEMSSSVAENSDIERIKLDIDSMVGRIVSVVDKFHADERVRRDNVYEHIESLGQRMRQMENEATELRASLEAARIQAMRDALTELPNRQAYDEYIEREYARWTNRHYPLSIAVCDIDRFKSINDTLGHLRGDKVLKLVSRELSRRVKSEYFVCRYGGEEFVVVMPDTDGPAAVAAMDMVRKSIEDCPFSFHNERITVTASFGVASFAEGDTVEACFERADKALYAAKNGGRNRIVSNENGMSD